MTVTSSWVVFLACLGICVYVYFGYPALILLVGRLRERPVRRAAITPGLSVIIPVHNEEGVIEEKIRNTLASDYPEDRLEVIVVSDGSTDRTNRIVRDCRDGRVRLLELDRCGKVRALNRGASGATGELLVLTDANAMLAPRSLKYLVEAFADPEVGGVCGNQVYRKAGASDSTASGESLYWSWDKWQKAQESRIGSIFAADGSLYALRRELYQPVEDPAQADDIAISARVVLQGKRLVFDPRALAFEEAPREGRDELRRKVRVTNHSVRALLLLGRGLFFSGFYSVELLSHKLLRHLVPLPLLGMLASAAIGGVKDPRLTLLFAAQVGFYALGMAGYLLRGRGIGRLRVLSIPYYFSLANLAALLGIASILRGQRLVAWSPRAGG